MASVFKKSLDKDRKGSCYYVAWTDENGKRRMRKAFRDRGLSDQLGAKLEREVMLRKRGLIDSEQDRLNENSRSPIAEHVESYRKALGNRGTTVKHVKLTLNRLQAVFDGCGIERIRDLQREKISDFLHDLRNRKKKPIGPRTFNHYIQALDGFCRWLVATERTIKNPVIGLERLNAEEDVRHRRRSLSPEEVALLIDGARSSGKKVQRYDGELRARLYLFSYLSGLRRKELASLRPESFDLGRTPPTLTVEAACSKHRRRDVLPLHPDLVATLSEWLPQIAAGEFLFPKLERKKTWFMVQKDLERVGIPYRTEEGVADFHATGRHSYITELIRSGASLTEARELARHGDIRMTMRYTHIGMDDRAAALASLPSPSVNRRENPVEAQQRFSSAGRPAMSKCVI